MLLLRDLPRLLLLLALGCLPFGPSPLLLLPRRALLPLGRSLTLDPDSLLPGGTPLLLGRGLPLGPDAVLLLRALLALAACLVDPFLALHGEIAAAALLGGRAARIAHFLPFADEFPASLLAVGQRESRTRRVLRRLPPLHERPALI